MTDSENNSTPPSRKPKEEALIQELRYYGDCFWHNEEAGERRVQFFMGLVTGVIAALGLIGVEFIKAEPEAGQTLILAGFSITLLIFLFIFGILTLYRIITRNCTTEEYRAAGNICRDQLALIKPLAAMSDHPRLKDKKPKLGGLIDIIAYTNGFILATIILVSTAFLWRTLDRALPPVCFGFSIALMLIAASAAFYFLSWSLRDFASKKRKRYREELNDICKEIG